MQMNDAPNNDEVIDVTSNVEVDTTNDEKMV